MNPLTLLRSALRLELVYACFVLVLCYAAFTWIVPIREEHRHEQDAPVSGIRALLFHTNRGLDFYFVNKSSTSFWQDTDIFSVADAPPDLLEKSYDDEGMANIPFDAVYDDFQTQTGISYVRDSVHITGSRDFLVQEGDRIGIFRTDQGRPYDVLLQQNVTMAVLDENRLKLLYAQHNDGYSLHMRYPTCDTAKVFPLGDRNPRAAETVRDAGLSPTKTIRLSPLHDTAIALDHDWFGTVRLVNLITGAVTSLQTPSFGTAQVHFNPTYLRNDQIAFSVLDGTRVQTVVYHTRENRYTVISNAFSDRIIPSQQGTIVLVQTFFDDAGNVPFGSTTMLSRKPSIPSDEIEDLFGDDRAWLDFFVRPTDPILSFRPELTLNDFHRIGDARRRNALIALWESRTGIGPKRGQHRLIEIEGTKVLQERIVPFDRAPSAGLFPYDQSISPLLELLNVPTSIRLLYEKTATEAERRGLPYRLVDVL